MVTSSAFWLDWSGDIAEQPSVKDRDCVNCRDVSGEETGGSVGVNKLGEAVGTLVDDGKAVGRQIRIGVFEGLLDGLAEDGDRVGVIVRAVEGFEVGDAVMTVRLGALVS